MATFEEFMDLDIRVGRVINAEDFPKARKPAYKLTIDFGPLGVKRSSAQIVNVYAPHGDLRGSPRFFQKIQWYKAFSKRMEELLRRYPKVLIVGDFNIALEDNDVWDPILLKDTVGTFPEEREALKALLSVGFVDVFMALYPKKVQFTWWDYRQGRIWKNQGMRIDYVFSSETLMPSLRMSTWLKK